jgi:hypothetical protein
MPAGDIGEKFSTDPLLVFRVQVQLMLLQLLNLLVHDWTASIRGRRKKEKKNSSRFVIVALADSQDG